MKTILHNKDNNSEILYDGAKYVKVDGIYGYLCVDGNNVRFFWSDGESVKMDTLINYKVYLK